MNGLQPHGSRNLAKAYFASASRWIIAVIVAVCSSSATASLPISYKHVQVTGVSIFYREAGDPSAPTILLLHGFPSSSAEFRDLIPLLAERFHVLAPDYPGMGYSDAPPGPEISPTFDSVAELMGSFLVQLGQQRVIVYMHDFGGPVGMRIIKAHPEWIAGIIVQNTTISLDGYNPARLKVFDEIGGKETPEKLAEAEDSATEKRDLFLHRTGAHDFNSIDPDDWGLDAYAFGIPEDRAFMSRMLMNISSNIPHYPEWNAVLRAMQPKTLIVWGRNDPVFTLAAAQNFKDDVPSAEIYSYDGGHFVLDEFAPDIAARIVETFAHSR